MKTVGEIIRDRRVARGITVTEVAKRVRCSIATVSAYETGYTKTRLDREVLARIAKLLGLSFTALAYRLFWQQRTPGITEVGMASFLRELAAEAKLDRQISQLKKKAAV